MRKALLPNLLLNLFIFAFCGTYIFVAFRLHGKNFDFDALYPFTSFPMFAGIHDERPYGVHKPFLAVGIKWELELSEPYKMQAESLGRKLQWELLQYRVLATHTGVNDPEVKAVVELARQFVLKHVGGPEDIKSIRMFVADYRVPPYPEKPVLTVVNKRLLGTTDF